MQNIENLDPKTQNVYNSVWSKFQNSGLAPAEYLKGLKVSPTSVRLSYYVIKKGCLNSHIPFEMSIKELPEMEADLSLLNEEGLTTENIIEMIKATKLSNYPINKAILAIATIFGTRCIELSRIKKEDIDLNRKLLLVRSAKGSNPRIHQIPDEIFLYLRDFRPISSQRKLWALFHKICSMAGINSNGLGYHSIRKRLFTELITNHVSYEIATYFLRWKMMGQIAFTHYYQPEIDRVAEEVYPKHPFLKIWKDEPCLHKEQ